jgi:DNA polymerase/3'-5' exonuclease PolX
MSTGAKIPYATALAAAQSLEAALEPYCARTLIAGSLRRRRPAVGDLELVVMPIVERSQTCLASRLACSAICSTRD